MSHNHGWPLQQAYNGPRPIRDIDDKTVQGIATIAKQLPAWLMFIVNTAILRKKKLAVGLGLCCLCSIGYVLCEYSLGLISDKG